MRSRLGLGVIAVIGAAGAARADEPPAWLRGTWVGVGYQEKTHTSWSVVLVADRELRVEYPSLRCGGHWTLERLDRAGVAWFTEHITTGRERCVDGGTISIDRIDPRVLKLHWTSGDDRANATLTPR